MWNLILMKSKENLDASTKAIFIVGPTGSGKSRLALDIAKKYNGCVVNCDSIQFYSQLKIGSSAPSDDDLRQAPHFLYSYVDAPYEMTAGQFLRDFYQLKNLSSPIVIVGGTGFYIQALEKGMFNVPQIDPQLKQQIENEIINEGNQKAYRELIAFDPESKIHVNDGYRIGRALEVKRAFNLKMSELKEQAELDTKLKLPFPYIKIGVDLEKDELKKNILLRTQAMLHNGWIDEVQTLIGNGFSNWAPLNSVGYFEVKEYLAGKISRTDLPSAVNQSTNKLIKKQRTWFKRDEAIQWVNPQSVGGLENTLNQIKNFLKG